MTYAAILCVEIEMSILSEKNSGQYERHLVFKPVG